MGWFPSKYCIALLHLWYDESMAKRKKFTPCKICTSPFRYQIESAWKNKPVRSKSARTAIAEKYQGELGYKTRNAFYRAVQRHFEHFKQAQRFPYLVKPDKSPHAIPKSSLTSLSQSLLDIGGKMANFYKENPSEARKKLSFNEIFKAQDALTNRMRVEVQQNALKIAMAKLFGGFLEEDVEEGELLDEESPMAVLSENTQR